MEAGVRNRRWLVVRGDGRQMDCRVTAARDGGIDAYEMCVFLDGEVVCRRLHASRLSAEHDGAETLADLLHGGWIEAVSTPRCRRPADSTPAPDAAAMLGVRCSWCGSVLREPPKLANGASAWTYAMCPDCQDRFQDGASESG
jgi:hypothetical protein